MMFPNVLLNLSIEEIASRLEGKDVQHKEGEQTMSPELRKEIIMMAYGMVFDSLTEEQSIAILAEFYAKLKQAKDENERKTILSNEIEAEIARVAAVIGDAEKAVIGKAIERLKANLREQQRDAQDPVKS